MKITKLSENFTPRQQGLFFGIDTEDSTPTELLTVEIIDTHTGEVIAEQTLRNVTTAKVNIAPYVVLPSHYESSDHQTLSFTEIERFSYAIRVNEIESDELVVSINRKEIDSTPAIISSQPFTRHIALGEYDEVMVIADSDSDLYAEITTNLGESISVESYCESGIAILSVPTMQLDAATRSFELRIECDGESLQSISYTVTPRRKSAVRLAWLSDEGTIERYSFPISNRTFLSISKRVTSSSDGDITAQCSAKESITICSRYEPLATITSLAQIAHSPKVWIEEMGESKSVEVTSSDIEYNLFGVPSCLALDICVWQKEVTL